MISSIRFKGKQNSSVYQILTNTLPQRRLKLFTMSHLPLISKHARSHKKLDVNRIIYQSFDGSYTFSKVHLNQGKNLSCVYYFLSTCEVETTISEYQNKHSRHFVSFLAHNVVTNVTSKPSYHESLSTIHITSIFTPIINVVDSRTGLRELNVLQRDFSAVLVTTVITNEIGIKYDGDTVSCSHTNDTNYAINRIDKIYLTRVFWLEFNNIGCIFDNSINKNECHSGNNCIYFCFCLYVFYQQLFCLSCEWSFVVSFDMFCFWYFIHSFIVLLDS